MTIIDAVRSDTPLLLAGPGNSPLHVLAGTRVDPAMRKEFEEAIKLRLSPLEDDKDAMKAMINAPNEYGATPLIYACMAGNEDIALLLIALGADVKIKDKDGMTAFHYAHRLRFGKVIQFFKQEYPQVVMDYFCEM